MGMEKRKSLKRLSILRRPFSKWGGTVTGGFSSRMATAVKMKMKKVAMGASVQMVANLECQLRIGPMTRHRYLVMKNRSRLVLGAEARKVKVHSVRRINWKGQVSALSLLSRMKSLKGNMLNLIFSMSSMQAIWIWMIAKWRIAIPLGNTRNGSKSLRLQIKLTCHPYLSLIGDKISFSFQS